jgi:hypothetical protein
MTEYHTRVVLEAESQRRDQAQNEGVSPDEKIF